MSVQSVTPASTTVGPTTTTAAPAPGTATTTADPAAKKPGEVDIDPAQLRQWSMLSKKAREAEAKAAAAEAKYAELEAKAKTPLEIRTLARARELGVPLEELFAEWVQEGQAGETGKATDAEARAKLEAIEKRLNDEAEARGKETEAQRTARYEQAQQATTSLLTDLLDEAGAPWKVSSRKENRGEAVGDARGLVESAVKAFQEANPGQLISDEMGDKWLRMALDEVEADLVEKGKRYNEQGATDAVVTAPTPRTAPVARTTLSNDRGTLRRPDASTAPSFTTYAAAKAELMQRLRSRKT